MKGPVGKMIHELRHALRKVIQQFKSLGIKGHLVVRSQTFGRHKAMPDVSLDLVPLQGRKRNFVPFQAGRSRALSYLGGRKNIVSDKDDGHSPDA
ncbi:hypothetical protein GCM10011402_37140 [Paracoccus acridae]|uniref:Uncharacterized protein n=1 Tax=Paracoccus acridae TaxID=1795310 RepID=A0ABQ1VPA9_9RHOB|nr:hypothetical protein GCM10011402_37140 [Paracoccus acridae]